MNATLDGIQISSPFAISPSLKLGVQIGDAWVSIDYSNREGREGRTRYEWEIMLPDGREFTGDDLQSGRQGGDLRGGMESLLCFLSAFGEANRPRPEYLGRSENSDLFPAELGEWAYQNSDLLGMLEGDLRENPSLIIE